MNIYRLYSNCNEFLRQTEAEDPYDACDKLNIGETDKLFVVYEGNREVPAVYFGKRRPVIDGISP